MKRSIRNLAVYLSLLVFCLSATAETSTARREVVSGLAEELLRGLNSSDLKDGSFWGMEKWWPAKEKRTRKIALWPFWKNKAVISEDFAQMLNDSLLVRLIQGKGPNDRYMVREELKVVTQELDEFSSLREASEKISNLMRQAGADLLIIGEVKPNPTGKSLNVHYKAVNIASGEVVAATSWYALDYDFGQTTAIGVNEAIQASARYFRDKLDVIKTLRLQGIRYRDSGVYTPFGNWIAGRLVSELRKEAVKYGETIVIGDAFVPEGKHRGIKLSERPAEREMVADAIGDYVLSGDYWDLGNTVDLRLKLTGSGNTEELWQGNIRRDSISVNLALKPPKDYIEERRTDGLGPITLRISSSRGRNPIYRIGQKMVLFIEVSQDGYLYCFYRQADSTVKRIFPNHYHKSARIEGGAPQMIPSKSMRFDWNISMPTGTEIVKCFAFDREIEHRLPSVIRKLDLKPLPYHSLDEVNVMLRQIRGVGIAENSMIVNIEQ